MQGFWEDFGRAIAPTALALLAFVGAEFQRRASERKKKLPRSVSLTHQEDIKITLVLDRARQRLNAQRVYLTQFFNGDFYLSNSSILKKNRTHEQVRDGVSYQAEKFKGMLVTALTEEMTLVQEKGPSFKAVREIKPSKFRWLCEQGGVKAVARCAVHRPKDGEIVGFVGADFDDEGPPPNIESLCDDAYQISQILAAYK